MQVQVLFCVIHNCILLTLVVSLKLKMKTLIAVIVGCLGIQLGFSSCLSSGEADLQSIADFWQKVVEYYQKFKAYSRKNYVCLAKLQELLDILGVPDDQDGAAKMAQNYFCGRDDVPHNGCGQRTVRGSYVGLFDTIQTIKGKVDGLGWDKACIWTTDEVMNYLGYQIPSDYEWAFSIVLGFYC